MAATKPHSRAGQVHLRKTRGGAPIMDVVRAWSSELQRILNHDVQLIQEVRVGLFYTAVQISSGHVGVAFTPRQTREEIHSSTVPAGHLIGAHAWQFAEFAFAEASLQRAIGLATLNALSELAIIHYGHPRGRIIQGLDLSELAEVRASDRVVVVGGSVPFLKTCKTQVASLWIVDKRRESLRPEERQFWMWPNRTVETVRYADVVFISGASLVELDIDDLLRAAAGARRVLLVGPTTPLWGPPFFARGVHALVGMRVHDSAGLLRLVSEGGCDELFDQMADNVTVLADERYDNGQAA
ncbi:MAG: Rossmann-like domain-containing protein [Candidatus Binataceae bacterium]